jgi:small subunit ribosomal protein S9
VRHGIARALVEADPELQVPLKRESFLTRDARKVSAEGRSAQSPESAPVQQAIVGA